MPTEDGSDAVKRLPEYRRIEVLVGHRIILSTFHYNVNKKFTFSIQKATLSNPGTEKSPSAPRMG
jgi:hypothetical protein